MSRILLVGLLALILLGAAACAQESSGPVEVIEAYLQARVSSDSDAVRNLSCAAFEAEALTQADSFRSMNATLEGMACSQTSEGDDGVQVSCEGKIVTVYANGETREWDLGVYNVVQEGGEWRMCGEATAN